MSPLSVQDTTRSALPTTRARQRSRTSHGFYGWHMVGYSALALALTAPGQTAAISAFVDPMIADLGVSRSAISTAYLVGTLTGALCLPWVGRALDRYGARLTMAVIGGAFGAVLIGLGMASDIVGLTAGFVGVRLAGQGALGLTATTAAAMWFTRRRGTALGMVSAAGAAGISMAPIALERLIATSGWRAAWVVEGLLIWAVVVPLALLAIRNRPSDLGQEPDGAHLAPASDDGTPAPVLAAGPSWTRGEAMRTPFFWVVTAGVAASGFLSTAVAFHQISLLTERGLSTTAAAANFLPQTLAALVATLLTGAAVDRFNPRWSTSASMLLLAVGLAYGTQVEPGLSAVAFGILIGAAGGSIRTLEAAAFPRYYGTAHLGSIRGLVTAISVGSTAFGPILFAVVHEWVGAYGPALLWSAPVPLAVAVAAAFVAPPATDAPH